MEVRSMGLKRIPCRVRWVLRWPHCPELWGWERWRTRKMSHSPSLAVAAVPAGALQGSTEPG